MELCSVTLRREQRRPFPACTLAVAQPAGELTGPSLPSAWLPYHLGTAQAPHSASSFLLICRCPLAQGAPLSLPTADGSPPQGTGTPSLLYLSVFPACVLFARTQRCPSWLHDQSTQRYRQRPHRGPVVSRAPRVSGAPVFSPPGGEGPAVVVRSKLPGACGARRTSPAEEPCCDLSLGAVPTRCPRPWAGGRARGGGPGVSARPADLGRGRLRVAQGESESLWEQAVLCLGTCQPP